MNNKDFLLVIPVYNESKYILKLFNLLEIYYRDKFILIVNDGSSDEFYEKIKLIKNKKLFIINHKYQMGYGASLIDGFKFAIDKEFQYIITMDCDLQHKPKFIKKFIENKDKADIISGSRYLLKDNSYVPEDRMNINKRITEKINKITGYNLTDSFCGMKLYNTEKIKKLNLTEKGYAFPIQLWIQAYINRLTVYEIPIKRIYFNVHRSFGKNLDTPFNRYLMYLKVLRKEVKEIENFSYSTAS